MDLCLRESVTEHMRDEQPLDPDTERLITELLTRVGIIMEDASVISLVSHGTSKNLGKRIDTLDHSAGAISALVRAARTLRDA